MFENERLDNLALRLEPAYICKAPIEPLPATQEEAEYIEKMKILREKQGPVIDD